jgi:putative DNA primase/helicase
MSTEPNLTCKEVITRAFGPYLLKPRWIEWDLIDGKKPPRNATTDKPETWRPRTQCRGKRIGIVCNGDGLGFLDLDACRNPETGEITEWAWDLIKRCNSYTEISPSKTGAKIFVTGAPADFEKFAKRMPGEPILGKQPQVEAFQNHQYGAVTGEHLPGTPLEIRDASDVWLELDEARPSKGNGHDRRRATRKKKDPAGRNDAMISFLGRLQAQGKSNDDIRAAAHAANRADSELYKDLASGEPLEERELETIIRSALRYPKGPATPGGLLVLKPTAPLDSARAFLKAKYTAASGAHLLRHHADVFRAWSGTHYPESGPATVRAELYHFLDGAFRKTLEGDTVPFEPTTNKVNHVLDALAAAAHLPDNVNPPAWLEPNEHEPLDLVACQNGLLHLPTRALIPHAPTFFNVNALPFDFDPHAGQPAEWLKFLKSIWSDDAESIATLQEVFGYCLTLDTRQQKIFLLVGPKRSGKGTIGRVLTALVGRDNVCAPTLAGLETNFGLQPLIGKQLAVISDARLGGRSDQQKIAERLLSISGEDGMTVDRKYSSSWTGRMQTRFLILTNELPRIADASGALASRFIPLVMSVSFFGREDQSLTDRLLEELPAILNWALDGRDRLAERGHFLLPQASIEVMQELEDLGSPISAFLREKCVVDASQTVGCTELFGAWQGWCVAQGRDHPGTAATFGRDLRAAVPTLQRVRFGTREDRDWHYKGVGLLEDNAKKPEESARKPKKKGPGDY